ncbi:threonine-phosphate decarboxylase [Thalassotalea insulae]|uniref:threonine-phosphate decarboxylase n=1 Tax=Thalassotalea insulae TaxID=2056778 RepID=A0ABQ6GWR0_9GAMM|nr:threonine-phosphate decarboxylase CobD [Thalassotalea insulae]GLX79759.1 threonine-phosphate decarboxylase [Thalassotalea insulae]
MTLIHGGQLNQIAKQYNIPVSDWLDLSTGIAPLSYPIPKEIPLAIWQQLPQLSEKLIIAAQDYYRCQQLVVTNGSQAVISALPQLYRLHQPKGEHVYLPERGYKEHAYAWQQAGFQLMYYQDELPPLAELTPHSVLVVINPNNPTGKFFTRQELLSYRRQMQKLDGLLIVDEAFIDVMPDESLASPITDEHTLALRSFGKFFGLAGLRIGFLIADSTWCDSFKRCQSPWQVNGPAQFIAEQALTDIKWQAQQKQQLQHLRQQQQIVLEKVFNGHLSDEIKGTDLFLTLRFKQPSDAPKLYHLLCQQGLYCRLTDEQDSLRFGIATSEQIPRLTQSCQKAKKLLLD